MHCSLYGFEPYLFHNKLPLRVCPVYSHLAGLKRVNKSLLQQFQHIHELAIL